MSSQNFIYKRIPKKQKGALLIEVILSVFIITTGLLAVMQLITNSLNDSLRAQNIIIATGLSQEGAELVRNIRDNSFVTTPDTPFIKFFPEKKYCHMEYNTDLMCSATFTSSHYTLGLSQKFYTSGTGKFSRLLYVVYNSATDQADVTSFVYWGSVPLSVRDGGKTDCTIANKCVYTEMMLTKWK